MQRPITDGFVDDNVSVADFYVVQARWIGADPCLVLD